MQTDSGASRVRYGAFISYNHGDAHWAAWLHRALETYRVPQRLIGRDSPFGPLGKRLPPIFRDREELATSTDLAASVREALSESAALIAICSPAAVRSRWVNEEIRSFAALGRADRIFCLIVDGEPHASSDPALDAALECFPPALLEHASAEPLAADVRPGMGGKSAARLKLIAGLIGVGYDELRQREAVRRQRRLALVATVSAIGFLLTSGLAVLALLARNEAVRQRDIARQKTLTAERTVDFVKSLFEVADPSEARGSTITAREILDRGAEQIDQGLSDEPVVKAELGTTLGEVYLGLGLLRQGDRLIRSSLRIRHEDSSTRSRQLLAFADSQTRQGHYRAAIASYRAALTLARSPDAPREDLVPRILVGLGEAHSAIDEFEEGDRHARYALALDVRRLGPTHPDVARDLEALGLNAFFRGDLDRARQLYARALAIRIQAQGASHPRVPEDLNTLGAIAYLQRDSATAERYYQRALASDEALLGPDHPDVAATLNNLARVMLERRSFVEARPLLRRAVAINLKQRSETHDDLAFTFANLAIAERGLGDHAEAEALLAKALRAARMHEHRNLAPILVDLADLRCRTGKSGSGLALLAEAETPMRSDYPDDPWRMAWLENTRGACLLAAGRRADAEPLLRRSQAVIVGRWPKGTLYAAIAAERTRAVGAGRPRP